ncbi:hypothetical protein LTR53_019691, partial [Teratosphaeriaceae sp. CCFEE 6253]
LHPHAAQLASSRSPAAGLRRRQPAQQATHPAAAGPDGEADRVAVRPVQERGGEGQGALALAVPRWEVAGV